MDVKLSTWRPGTAVCRCCLAEGCYKDISTEYFWMGKREVYAEMLTDTFDLNISYSQSGGPNSNSRLICEPCISRLRDASEFKRQVYDCEKMFMQHLEPTGSGVSTVQAEAEPDEKGVKTEEVKQEKEDSGDDFFDDRNDFGMDDDDDLDDEPLTNLATKIPKKEKEVDLLDFLEKPAAKPKAAAEKRKAPAAKPKAVAAKKAKVVKEAKPSASKDKVVEKKKKDKNGDDDFGLPHTQLLLRHSTLYPFKLDRRKQKITCFVCFNRKATCTFDDPNDFRLHVQENHSNIDFNDISPKINRTGFLRVDIADLRCKKCNDHKTFNSLKSISEHLNEMHDIEVIADMAHLVPVRLEVDKFVCTVCNKVIRTLSHLYSHSGTHFAKYICDHCKKSYETKIALIYHLKNEHTDMALTCKRCKKVLPSKKALSDHIKTNEICFPHACLICRKRFNSYLHREQHLVDVHNRPKKSYPCTECDKIYDKRNSLYLHFKAAHTEDFKCTCCSRTFDTKRAYTEHVNRQSGYLPFQCNYCQKAFPVEHRLNAHLVEHEPERRRVKPGVLNAHLVENAKSGLLIDCPVCRHKPRSPSSLKAHVRNCHPEKYEQYYGKDNRKIYYCSVCAYSAHVMNRLKLHVKRMHPDVFETEFGNDTTMFYCSACAFRNRLKQRLKAHVAKAHPEIFPHEFPVDQGKMKVCSACPYKNTLKCKLKLHVKRCHPEIYDQEFGNTVAKYNYCSACTYKIRGERSLLKLHVKKEHPELFKKEFKPDDKTMKKCPACPFKNQQRFRLVVHVKRWHPEIFEREFGPDTRPTYKCPSCEYTHFQKCRLKLHVKRKHPEIYAEMDVVAE